MSDCQKLERLLTPYVDGEAVAAERQTVDAHLRVCPPCRARAEAERAVRDLLQHRRVALADRPAPERLRTRCRAAAHAAAPPSPRPLSAPAGRLRVRALPLALAASLTLVVAGAFLYQATTRSARVLAAELAADHVKCFAANRLIGLQDEQRSAVQSYLASSFGWRTELPVLAGLTLEAARPCLYGEGRAAHVMYRYGGQPVSLFMLPGTMRRDELIEVMGHEAAIWSGDGRTFVLVARQSRDEVERLAAAMQGTLK